MLSIAELQSDTVVSEIEIEIVSKKVETIETSRFTGRMARRRGRDNSGEVELSLWGDQVDEFEVGDTVRIENGWVREWNNEKIVTRGRGGSIKLVKRTPTEKGP